MLKHNVNVLVLTFIIAVVAFVAGYLSHKEVYYHYVPTTVTATATTTTTATVTETQFIEPKIYVYKHIENLDVELRVESMKFKVYLTNKGNETIYGVNVYLLSRDPFFGTESFEKRYIDEIEPGVTRVAEFPRVFLSYIVFLIITR